MIGITSNDNGVGLSRDIKLLQSLIEDETDFFPINKKPVKRFNSIIHVELVNGRCFRQANKHFLMGNQEWFFPMWLNSKGRFKATLCKTKIGQEIFTNLGFNSIYTGFTSEDRHIPVPVNEKVPEFLHIAGQSKFKGTDLLIEAWQDNFPTLHIFTQHDFKTDKKNVVIRKGYLEDAELKKIQNKYLYHLCPSIVEGWGHYILESMSTGAMVMSTNASPMNEHFTKDMGFLVDYDKQSHFNYGTTYFASIKSIQNNVEAMLKCKDIEQRSLDIRQRFVDIDKMFRSTFWDKLRSL